MDSKVVGLDRLAAKLRNYLRRRWPSLRADHDDLVASTFEAMLRRPDHGLSDLDKVSPLAFTILERRIADSYRASVRRYAAQPLLQGPTFQAPLESVLTRRRALRVSLGYLASLEPQDRELLLDLVSDSDLPKPLDPRLRKRRQRLVDDLRRLLEQAMGESVRDILESS